MKNRDISIKESVKRKKLAPTKRKAVLMRNYLLRNIGKN